MHVVLDVGTLLSGVHSTLHLKLVYRERRCNHTYIKEASPSAIVRGLTLVPGSISVPITDIYTGVVSCLKAVGK